MSWSRPAQLRRAGQIFESNALMLRALALGSGAAVPLVEHCPDDLERMTELFRRGIENDALIVSGGVSVGEHDLVKPALRALGAEIDLWRVAIKPGKPFLFSRAGRCAVFGLPGNPVSAFVTFLKFVRPALLKMSGAAEDNLALRQVSARLAGEASNDGDRPHYLRGRLQDGVFTRRRFAGVARTVWFKPGERIAARRPRAKSSLPIRSSRSKCGTERRSGRPPKIPDPSLGTGQYTQLAGPIRFQFARLFQRKELPPGFVVRHPKNTQTKEIKIMKLDSLRTLWIEEMRDLYNAENQLAQGAAEDGEKSEHP